MCHSERSEEPDNESIAIGLHGFFATLRMTHLQGLSAWIEKGNHLKSACHAKRIEATGEAKERTRSEKNQTMKYHNYFVYITTNPKKTVLYTGVTNDLGRRMEEHLADHLDTRKTFAGKYFCYNLIYCEYYFHIEWAIAREKQIKGWTRKKKEGLIAKFNSEWRFLNSEVEIAKGNLPVWIIGEEPWD